MKTRDPLHIGSLASAALLVGCATSSGLKQPDAPAELRPPSNQQLALEVPATGVQIYECAPKKDQPDQFEWAFKAPEAQLFDRAGRKIGIHYAGPSWEAPDGSKVVGEVKARDPGPDPNAIPLLLLNVKSIGGAGVFSQVKSIQRLQTRGGKAPSTPCAKDSVGQQARVPYTAVYYFYVAKP